MNKKQILLRGLAAAALTIAAVQAVPKVEACQQCGYTGQFPLGQWYSYCQEGNDYAWDFCIPGNGQNQDCTVGGQCGNWS
ncbi:MAG: hypothetical protein P4L56_12245 [Candidatus Sulfopaludibacter sp.]|nr:hypothetical protein [Candidatus Sulfopaludibacter sp.]